jgi:hypothetical protein
MKNVFITVMLLALGVSAVPAHAANPCEVVVCMYGKVTGTNGGNSCKSPEKAFFDINVFKRGIFQPWKTADLRKALLDGCPTANPADIASIISKFGKIRG